MQNSDSTKNNNIHYYPKDTVIFREGDTNKEMYFVLKGTVVLSTTLESRPVIVDRINLGGFFGEMSLIEGEKRSVTAVTADNTILMVIDKENFNEVISKNPQLAYTVITGLCLRLRDLGISTEQAAPAAIPVNEVTAEIAATTQQEAEQIIPHAENTGDSSQELVLTVDKQPTAKPTDETGQKKCIEITPELYDKYCFVKEITCPVCEYKFKTDLIRESRLLVKERTDELRQIYSDIEPLFFNIWVCPECYYSMKRTEFDKITDIQRKNLANQIALRKSLGVFDFNNKLCYDFALLSHRVAIDCCDSLGKKNIEDRIAALWLNIAWLYDDLEQNESAAEARANALAKYKNAYIFGTDRTDAQDQKMEYLIGKLSWEIGNIKEAKDHFFKIVKRRQAHQLLKQMAQDGLSQLKNL